METIISISAKINENKEITYHIETGDVPLSVTYTAVAGLQLIANELRTRMEYELAGAIGKLFEDEEAYEPQKIEEVKE